MVSFQPANQTNQTKAAPRRQSAGPIIAGIVLLLPALLCCVMEMVIPTVRTFVMSLQDVAPLAQSGEFIGLENYTTIFGQPATGPALIFTLISLVVRLAVVAVVPPVLAWAAARCKRPVRLGVRVALAAPVALFIPIAVTTAWLVLFHPADGLIPPGAFISLADPGRARAALLVIDTLYTFGLACGLGAIVYMPIWRRPDGSPALSFKDVLRPLLATWGVGILATAALTLGTLGLGLILPSGGPGRSTLTLSLLFHQLTYVMFSFGPGAAIASLILLATLALGTAAGLLVILTRVRLAMEGAVRATEDVAEQPDTRKRSPLPAIVLGATLLIVMGACLISALPFGWLMPQSFAEGGFGRLLEEVTLGRSILNTLAPPLAAVAVQLGVAYLAALGIGALQPLGKHSAWLLLPFSPWLFVTVVPLSLSSLAGALKLDENLAFLRLVPPILFSVPALFVLTLFFRGQADAWRRETEAGAGSKAAAFFNRLILPSLPLVGVLLVLMLFAGWQSVYWPMLAGRVLEGLPLSVTLYRLRSVVAASKPLLAAGMTLVFVPLSVFCFLGLSLFHLLYLDRLVLDADPPKAPPLSSQR